MQSRRTPTNDIWRKCFQSSRGEIQGTKLKNGDYSKVYLSSLNTGGRATISYPLTVAIVEVAKGNVSFGQLKDGTIWAECRSKNNNVVCVTKYKSSDKILQVFAAEKRHEVSYNFVTSTYVDWTIFVPRVVELLRMKQGEFYEHFMNVRKELLTKGTIESEEASLYILNDYLYYSRIEYISTDQEVLLIPLHEVRLVKDLTLEILGEKGNFEFASLSSENNAGVDILVSYSVQDLQDLKLEWDRELSDEEKQLIPNLDLSFIKISPQIKKIATIVKNEINSKYPVNNILLYGEAGSGKSTAAKILAQLWGVPYRFINLSLNSEEADLIGTYRPKADGTFEFFEPAFAQTFRNGGVIELMEINYARPGVLGILNSALDDTARITLGNGEVVRRNKNCIIIATTNVNYAGCQRMNEALKDRFHQIIYLDKFSDNDLAEIVMRASGNTDKALVLKMIDAARKISIKIQEEQITGGVCSTRQIINWARDVKYSQDPILSAWNTILPGVSFDREVQEEIVDTILKPMF